ncbi:MAG TPA: universal stress protein [Caulobacteraceae bacterium]|jgi:nucleotide-binding universal stress UspA family protein
MTDPIVLVPLDGSKTALGVLPLARRLAGLAKAHLRILHVTEAARPLGETAGALGLQPADLRGATLEARAGDPADAIVAAAADCQCRLIVMRPHSADAAPAGAISDTALAVLRAAVCPVVLVDATRAQPVWDLRRMLALHDGSPAVSRALAPVADLVREAGAELMVLQVAHEARAQEAGSIAPPVYVDQVQYSWPAWSAEFLHRMASICPLADVPVRLLLGHGEPADEAVRVAGEESADLIVLAWTGHGDDASTLKAVLRDAPCPIMVTREVESGDESPVG